MKATVLVDNIAKDDLEAEWGLAFAIEYEGVKILLDTGKSGLFIENAKALGIDLEQIDYGVLSHGHYDHADGLGHFFELNKKATFYLRETAQEKHYHRKTLLPGYIGINRTILKKYKRRMQYVTGDYRLTEGVSLIPHKTMGLESIGRKNSMYTIRRCKIRPDDFSHEQSLVFETSKGLVIFNSCSHGGADNIIREVRDTYSNQEVYALIGGLHLYRTSEEDVRELARKIKEVGIQKIYTGHCTGEKAVEILQEELGNIIENFYTGMELFF